MPASGSPAAQGLSAEGLRVAVVATRWYAEITDALHDSAVAACKDAGAAVTSIRVPGAFELPVVCARAAETHDAVVAVGLVVRGGTPHFEYVCSAATEGLTRVALDSRTPIGFGLLTCDTMEQARDRSGLPGSSEDKGREAAEAALETALTLRSL